MSETLTPAERAQAAGECVEALAVETRPKTLMAREEYLALLREAADEIPPELEAAFKADVEQSVRESREKRDACAAWLDSGIEEISVLDAKIAAMKQVVQRLESRKKGIAAALDRYKDYLLGAIQLYGEWDRTKKYKLLAGETCTLKANRGAPSVDIVDAAAIPLEYQGIELKLSASQYVMVRRMFDKQDEPVPLAISFGLSALHEAVQAGTLVPSKTLIAQTLKHPCPQCIEDVHEACAVCGGTGFERVLGATLRRDALRLVVS